MRRALPRPVLPWPADESQRQAVRAAMTRRLSTVTGPPGSGKTTLVANLVATASGAGQRGRVAAADDRAVHEVWRRCAAVPGALVRTGAERAVDADADQAPDLAEALVELTAAERRAARARLDLAAVGRIDEALDRLRTAVAGLPGETLLLLAGISEVNDGRSQLHVGMAEGPGLDGGWLVSASTGRAPFAQLIDLAPTALRALGLDEELTDGVLGGHAERVFPGL